MVEKIFWVIILGIEMEISWVYVGIIGNMNR